MLVIVSSPDLSPQILNLYLAGTIGTTRESFMFQGLEFFWNFVKASSEDKVKIIIDNLYHGRSMLTKALCEEPVDYVFPIDTYAAYEALEDLRFHGDNDIHGPNAAWPWSRHYKVEVFYFQTFAASFRRWGYVMWDFERLERWKVLEQEVGEMSEKKYDAIKESPEWAGLESWNPYSGKLNPSYPDPENE
jgi:hypothetical protein